MAWPVEINSKIFQVFVNRDDQTIIASGEADNEKER